MRHAIISIGSARILLHNKRELTALVLCICVDELCMETDHNVVIT